MSIFDSAKMCKINLFREDFVCELKVSKKAKFLKKKTTKKQQHDIDKKICQLI